MGIFYGNKIYGVRLGTFNADINRYEALKVIFELKFQLLTNMHMNLIKDAFQKVQQEEQNSEENIQYYFQRTMATTHEWCSNSDEVVYYAWVKCNKEDMERFIQENDKNREI